MIRRSLVGFLFLVAVSPVLAAEVRGVVDSVTVYRGQALVSRLVDLAGAPGLREVVVTDLPEFIEPASLYAETTDGLEVRSVSYRMRPVEQDVREEVRKLDDQLAALQDDLTATGRHKQVLAERKAYLDKLEQFSAATANVELTKGLLNAETLKSLTLFLQQQRAELAEEELKLGREERGLAVKIETISRQRQTVAGGSARTVREAVVFLNITRADGAKLRLNYLVGNATWSPSYNIRTDAGRTQITAEYFASIQQMSGENWDNVQMTLSTATPTLVAKAPELKPLNVALAAITEPKEAAKAGYREELAARKVLTEQARNQAGNNALADNLQVQFIAPVAAPTGVPGGLEGGSSGSPVAAPVAQPSVALLDKSLNDIACEMELLDLAGRGRTKRPTEPEPGQEGLSITYNLSSRTSLPSRSDQQLVQIASLPLKGEFYKVATPVLTNFVYDEASVTNSSALVLLAGPASTYVDGRFVGHGEVPIVTVGQKFVVGLGIDSALRANRELVNREEKTQGGNRVIEFTYRMTLENYGAAAQVRVLDRVPAGNDSDIKVTLVGEDGLSQAASYPAAERKKGLLRWDLDIAAQSTGSSAKYVEYKFKLEYDKAKQLTGAAVASR